MSTRLAFLIGALSGFALTLGAVVAGAFRWLGRRLS